MKETTDKEISFPLTLNYAYTVNPDGNSQQVVTSDQKDIEFETKSVNGFPIFGTTVAEQVHSTDSLNFSAAGALVSATPTAASASYKSQDTLGSCYTRQVVSAARVVTAVTDATGCPTKR